MAKLPPKKVRAKPKKPAKRAKQFTMMELADMMGVDYGVVKRGAAAIANANAWGDLRGNFVPHELIQHLLTYIDELHRGALNEDQYKALRAAERKDRK